MSAVLERNNVKVLGQGQQPMIFAHGFGCDQNMWRFVAPAFEDDFRVVLFDHVGAGRSDLAPYAHKQPGEQGTLIAFLRQLLKEKTRAEWLALLENHDLCMTPVNQPREAFVDPHVVARGTVIRGTGRIEPLTVPLLLAGFSPVVAYNVVFLLSIPAAALAAHALAYRLTGDHGPWAASLSSAG